MKQLLNPVLFSIFLIASCNKYNDSGTSVNPIPIYYIDSAGNSLFSNYDGQNGYWMDSLQVSDLNGDKRPLTCFENGTGPRRGYNFSTIIVLQTNFCPNSDVVNSTSMTLIQLKMGVYDTLKVQYDQNNISPSTNVDQVWYNGKQLKLDNSIGAYRVVK